MSKSVNKAILIGNIAANLEAKELKSGAKMVVFSVATDREWTMKGKTVKMADFHRIVVFGKQVAEYEKTLSKGDRVYLEGKIVNRSYTNGNGDKKYVTEIMADLVVALDKKKEQAADEEVTDEMGY